MQSEKYINILFLNKDLELHNKMADLHVRGVNGWYDENKANFLTKIFFKFYNSLTFEESVVDYENNSSNANEWQQMRGELQDALIDLVYRLFPIGPAFGYPKEYYTPKGDDEIAKFADDLMRNKYEYCKKEYGYWHHETTDEGIRSIIIQKQTEREYERYTENWIGAGVAKPLQYKDWTENVDWKGEVMKRYEEMSDKLESMQPWHRDEVFYTYDEKKKLNSEKS